MLPSHELHFLGTDVTTADYLVVPATPLVVQWEREVECRGTQRMRIHI